MEAAIMDYSQLPEDIVEKIATYHLEIFSQLIAFSGVSKSWRSAALRLHPSRRPSLPGLLVPKPTESDDQAHYNVNNADQIHQFSPVSTLSPSTPPSPPPPPATPSVTFPSTLSPSMTSDVLFHDEFSATLDPGSNSGGGGGGGGGGGDELAAHSLGSKDGWILRTLPRRCHVEPLNLYLLNPITAASIPLPPLPASSAANLSSITQAVISSSPDDDDEECHVFIVFRTNPQLAWCHVSSYNSSSSVKGQGWNFTSKNTSIFNYPFDALYFGRKFYVLDDHAIIVFRNPASSTAAAAAAEPMVVRAFPLSEAMVSFVNEVMPTYCCHLCHLLGQVHVIVHGEFHADDDDDTNTNVALRVYKLVVVGGGGGDAYHWEEVRSLDGHAVFFGAHQSFTLPASTNGVRDNHIYFSSDHLNLRPHWYRCTDCDGVFDLVNQKFERFALDCGSDDDHETTSRRPYFWFLPMPWDISKLRRHRKKSSEDEEGSETSGARYWTLPKNTMKNHQQPSDSTSNSDDIVINNQFQALVLDDE